MKQTLGYAFVILSLAIAAPVFADRTTVNGKTYECSNSCSVNTGPPTTIQDCCGGTVVELKRDAIVIEG